MFGRSKKRIYLDHAAATSVDRRVMQAMQPYWGTIYDNPGGIARGALLAHEAIEKARSEVAEVLHARAKEIVFTNGGTESNNIAIQGVVQAFRRENPDVVPHVITSSIEHAAVQTTCKRLEEAGKIELSEIPVDKEGVIDIRDFKELLQDTTILVSVMYVNNEIGTIQPVREITKTVRWFKKQHNKTIYPLVHTDAIQAINYLDMSVDHLGIDLMSISAAKIYGPKGIGVVYAKDGTPIDPLLFGGEQEYGLRPGTENVPLIVGMARALTLTEQMRESEVLRLAELQTYFFEKLQKFKEYGLRVNGSIQKRIPNNINISFLNISGEQLVIELDARDISCSSQSACTSFNESESHVIRSLYPDADIQAGTLRFSMGRNTEKRDIDKVIKVLGQVLHKISDTQKRFEN